MSNSFEDLEVWKRGCIQAVEIYQTFEDCKDFSLKNQMERAAVSVPSNIAEGQERSTTPDFKRFLGYSKSSNGELRTQLYIATKLNMVTKEKSNKLINESKQISKMLQGLINSLD